MSDSAFLDTNVLVYAFDGADSRKQQAAAKLVRQLLERGMGVVSTQVLQEFFVTVTRKVKSPLSVADARSAIEDFAVLRVVGIDVGHILDAIERHQRLKLSFWDALILTAAADSGCRTLYTEDLSPGSVLDGVEIVSPFPC